MPKQISKELRELAVKIEENIDMDSAGVGKELKSMYFELTDEPNVTEVNAKAFDRWDNKFVDGCVLATGNKCKEIAAKNPDFQKATMEFTGGGGFKTLGVVIDNKKTYPDMSKPGETVTKYGATRVVMGKGSEKGSELHKIKDEISANLQELALKQLK
jgi:hypothetical protein